MGVREREILHTHTHIPQNADVNEHAVVGGGEQGEIEVHEKVVHAVDDSRHAIVETDAVLWKESQRERKT